MIGGVKGEVEGKLERKIAADFVACHEEAAGQQGCQDIQVFLLHEYPSTKRHDLSKTVKSMSIIGTAYFLERC
jgi:hypothetical protein